MTDDKRELNNGEGAVASGFGASEADPSADAFGAFPSDGESDTDGSYSSDPLHREEIVTEHLDELPDVENVEELIGDGHVYDEETAGALVALMFAKEHQTEEDQSYAAEYADTVSAGIGVNGSQYGTEYGREGGWSDGFSGTNIRVVDPPKKNKLGWIVAVILAAIALIVTVASLERCGAAFDEPSDFEFIYSNNYDGTVTLTKYNGDGGVVYIPETVNGFTVVAIGGSTFEGNTSIEEVYVPSTVRTIGNFAFGRCKSLKAVNLSDGLEAIGESAFYGCSSLTEIDFPDSLTYIDAYAFHDCDALTYISLPGGTESLGYGAFYNCSSLSTVSIPPSLKTVGNEAFAYCYELDAVHIRDISAWFNIDFMSYGSNPLCYGGRLFVKGIMLEHITVPEDISRIKDYALYGVGSVKSIELQEGVTSIGGSAFAECDGMQYIYIPSSVNSIDSTAFLQSDNLTLYTALTYRPAGWDGIFSMVLPVYWGCTGPDKLDGYVISELSYSVRIDSYKGSVSDLVIPSSFLDKPVVEIGNSAFSDNPHLTSVVIPSTVESIGIFSFGLCLNLESVIIPKSVTSIGASAFVECPNLTIYCEADSASPWWDSYWNGDNSPVVWGHVDSSPSSDFDYYAYGGEIVINGYKGSSPNVVIPREIDGITVGVIADHAFDGASFESIVVPGSVRTVGNGAFMSCLNLRYVDLREGITEIGDSVFAHCFNLCSIKIPASVSSIGESAFGNCERLVEIINNSSIVIDSSYADIYGIGKSLLEIHTGDYSKLDEREDGFVFYTVDGTSYLVAYYGNDSEPILPDGYNGENYEINYGAFYRRDGITKLEIPASVSAIGESAFANCSALEKVTIGGAITEIADYTFYECTSLSDISIPYGVTSIGYCAFNECSSLEKVVIPNGVVSIGGGAFGGCGNLVGVSIPASVLKIGSWTFSECPNLTLYCKASSELSGWENNWNSDGRPVEWGSVLGADSSDFSFHESGGEITITGYRGTGGDVVIPEEISGYPVTAIDHAVFRNMDYITSVYIPSGVTDIGDQAFFNCSNLRTIYFNAKKMNAPESNTHMIWGGVGTGVSVGTTLVIGRDVEEIPDYAFYRYDVTNNITSIVFENGGRCKTVGEGAFFGLNSLKSVTLGESVELIGDYAFSSCDVLTSIVIPDNGLMIGEGVFRWCNNLTIFCKADSEPDEWNDNWNSSNCPVVWGYIGAVPESPTSDFRYTVSNGEVIITGYTGSESVVVIPREIDGMPVVELSNVFNDILDNLTIYIPNTVTRISGQLSEYHMYEGKRVYYCEAYEKPSEWPDMWSSDHGATRSYYPVVWGCTGAFGITSDGFRWAETNSGIAISGYVGTDTNIKLPEIINGKKVTEISEAAFSLFNSSSGSTAVTGIEIPNSITKIGSYAFYGYSGLTRIVIPDSVTSIGDSAFAWCDSLTIYCEAYSMPDGWDSYWNPSNLAVIWGYNPEEQ